MKNYLVTFLLFCLHSFSQNQYLQKAQAYQEIAYYTKAIEFYQKHIAVFPNDVPVYFKLATCYQHLNMTDKQIKIYDYCWQKKILPDSLYWSYFGLLLKQKNLKACDFSFNRCANEKVKKAIQDRKDSVKKWFYSPKNFKIQSLENINTKYSEIAPIYHEQLGIAYLSNKEGLYIRKKNLYNNQPNYNILKTSYDTIHNCPSILVSRFSAKINTRLQEGGLTFSKDYKTVFYSRAYAEYDGTYKFKLYQSEKKRGMWTDMKIFSFNDSTASFTHPFINKDNNLFFFSSDMAGGFGGKDLYVCIKVDSIWSEPINLGEQINTKGNELFPFLDENQNLYFSSDTHLGVGGYDIFVAKEVNGEWQHPTNMGFPINSFQDDFSIHFINYKTDRGFVTSNRSGGKGLEDIYLVTKLK
ncbi:MAG: hypothetical protein U0V72_06070 [Cytophagales bacterium]